MIRCHAHFITSITQPFEIQTVDSSYIWGLHPYELSHILKICKWERRGHQCQMTKMKYVRIDVMPQVHLQVCQVLQLQMKAQMK